MIGVPTSWVGLPALSCRKSCFSHLNYNFLTPRILWWKEINLNRRHCFNPYTSLVWWSLRKTGITQVCWGSVISHLKSIKLINGLEEKRFHMNTKPSLSLVTYPNILPTFFWFRLLNFILKYNKKILIWKTLVNRQSLKNRTYI